MTERVKPEIRELAKRNVLIAYSIAAEDHRAATGHRIHETFWESHCLDCEWARHLTCTGKPFNPNVGGEFQLHEGR